MAFPCFFAQSPITANILNAKHNQWLTIHLFAHDKSHAYAHSYSHGHAYDYVHGHIHYWQTCLRAPTSWLRPFGPA